MTEYLDYEREIQKRKDSIRFMTLYTLACITAVVIAWYIGG